SPVHLSPAFGGCLTELRGMTGTRLWGSLANCAPVVLPAQAAVANRRRFPTCPATQFTPRFPKTSRRSGRWREDPTRLNDHFSRDKCVPTTELLAPLLKMCDYSFR